MIVHVQGLPAAVSDLSALPVASVDAASADNTFPDWLATDQSLLDADDGAIAPASNVALKTVAEGAAAAAGAVAGVSGSAIAVVAGAAWLLFR